MSNLHRKDRIGEKIGIFTAIKPCRSGHHQEWIWKYRCDKCKKIFEHLPSHLRNYPTKNCYHIKKPKPIRIIKGYIYLIQVHKYFKIGKTLDIKMRIRKYIAENPYEIKVIIFKKVKNYTKAETQLLKKFRKKKYRNEWFLLNENDTRVLKDFLDKLK